MLNVGDVITIDGGTGRVIVGPVRLVPPAIDENFGTILDWADELRRLRVRANADTPGGCRQGARVRRRGHRPLPHRAHVHGPGPAADRAGDDPGARRGGAPRRARQAAADAAVRLRGHLRGDGRASRSRSASSTRRCTSSCPSLEEATSDDMRRRITELHESNPMLGTRGCRLGLQWPEIYEMQVRAIVRAAAAVGERTGAPPLVEIMHPLVGFREELARLRELTERVAARGARGRVPLRHDDRAAARVHPRRRDRRGRGLLLVRHERPHPDGDRASPATTRRASSSPTTSSTGSSSATRSRCSTRKASAT